LHAYGVNAERQNAVHTTEVPLREPNFFEITIQNLQEYKLPGTEQIPIDLFQVSGKMLPISTNFLILFQLGRNAKVVQGVCGYTFYKMAITDSSNYR
jgi:hypothetical protein